VGSGSLVEKEEMMATRFRAIQTAVGIAVFLCSGTGAAPRTFVPDYTFTGSALTGWSSLGGADWKAQNGEIVGMPKADTGGWLIFDGSFQDVGLSVNFKCAPGCKGGLLFRAERTGSGGMKGVFMSLNPDDLAAYAVVLDAHGRELSRETLGAPSRLRTNAATYLYPLRDTSGPGPAPLMGKDFPPPPATLDLRPDIPPSRPAGVLNDADWNELEVVVDARSTRTIINEGPLASADREVPDEAGRYGPVALFVGGTGEVRFKDLALKDLNNRSIPAEAVSDRFRMQRLDEFYYAWSAAVADVNRDGVMDVLTGPLYYLGPAYTQAKEIYLTESYDGATQYARGCMVSFAHDFTGDGWPDQWCATGNNGQGPGVLFVNPQTESRRWDRYVVTPDVWIEETILRDVDGDGRPELVMGVPGGTIALAKPDPAAPTKPWIVTPISEPGPWGANSAHGIGVGDVNGDGRLDVVTAWGWWEQPASMKGRKLWTHHPVAFGRWGKSQGGAGGAEMAVYDVNGDGLTDIVTSLEAHGWGLAWFEQKKGSDGKISFARHMIMDNFQTKNAGGVTFTELHGAGAGDVDGDGLSDFIVGKRHFSHLNGYSDPDPYGPAVLYWYRLVRTKGAPGGAEFVPELIHNRSGVGSHIVISDVNQDGRVDVVTSTTRGSYIFWGRAIPK
jgi:hypothetical protein